MTSKLTAARLAFTNRSARSTVSVLGNAAFMRAWAGRRLKASLRNSAAAAVGDASGREGTAQQVSNPEANPDQRERPTP